MPSWYNPLRTEITYSVLLPKDSSSPAIKKRWMGRSEGILLNERPVRVTKNREQERNCSKPKATKEMWQLNARWVPGLACIPKQKRNIIGTIGNIWMRPVDWIAVLCLCCSLYLDSYKGYVEGCPWFSEMHTEVFRRDGVSYLQLAPQILLCWWALRNA